jgi:hypothetical protein
MTEGMKKENDDVAVPPRGLWTEDMREISGFGGAYERCCREMVRAGLKWFDEHPDAKPQFKGYRGVVGLLMDDNDDAKALSKAVCEPAEANGGATGAMHQAAVGHVLLIRKQGWAAYVAMMRTREAEE